MKIDEYYKLGKIIDDYSFRDSYKTINTILIVLSVLGNLTSIFLANYLIVKIFSSIISEIVVVNIISLLLLSGLELLKRDFFAKLSFQYLKSGGIKKDVIPLLITSFVIVSTSFYATIKGASEFSSKEDHIESVANEKIESYQDSINIIYNDKISSIESEIVLQKSKIEDKDKEQTSLSSLDRMNYQQRLRVMDLKQEKSDLKSYLGKLEDDLKGIKDEKEFEIKEYENKISEKSGEDKNENSTNSIYFIIISTIIELTILIGVYFDKYYKFRSYKDFKSKLESNSGYQKWVVYDKIIHIIYGKDKSVGDKLPSSKTILEICRANEMKISQKDILDFLKIMSSLSISKTSGSTRTLQKAKDEAISTIKGHFNIE